MKLPMYYKVTVEIDEADIKPMFKEYEVPFNEETLEDFLDRFRDDIENQMQDLLDNVVSDMSNDYGPEE